MQESVISMWVLAGDVPGTKYLVRNRVAGSWREGKGCITSASLIKFTYKISLRICNFYPNQDPHLHYLIQGIQPLLQQQRLGFGELGAMILLWQLVMYLPVKMEGTCLWMAEGTCFWVAERTCFWVAEGTRLWMAEGTCLLMAEGTSLLMAEGTLMWKAPGSYIVLVMVSSLETRAWALAAF